MNIGDICNQVKSLILNILQSEKELNKLEEISLTRSCETISLLTEYAKKIAPIYINRLPNNLTVSINSKRQIIWDKNLGFGVKLPNYKETKPLLINEIDDDIEKFLNSLLNSLKILLDKIQSEKAKTEQKVTELEKFIDCLKKVQD